MELGSQRLVLVHLRVSIGDSVIGLVLLLLDKHADLRVRKQTSFQSGGVLLFLPRGGRTNIVSGTDADLAQVDGEDGV